MTDSNSSPIVVLASNNKGKLLELQQMVGDSVQVRSASDLGVEMPEETGITFAENATLKSAASFAQTGYISLADDSGLEVDALEGRPGVYSARYSGENATDEANNKKLLGEMENVPESSRTARFRSAISITIDADTHLVFEGTCEGSIGYEPRGDGGFGYDPLFQLANGRTMAELPAEEKNAISHRGVAMRRALPVLLDHLGVKDDES